MSIVQRVETPSAWLGINSLVVSAVSFKGMKNLPSYTLR